MLWLLFICYDIVYDMIIPHAFHSVKVKDPGPDELDLKGKEGVFFMHSSIIFALDHYNG